MDGRTPFTLAGSVHTHWWRPMGGGAMAAACSARARCVVLSNGMVGAEKQALALAETIGLPFEVRRTTAPALSRLPSSVLAAATHLLGSSMSGLAQLERPYPALAISCGRGSIPASIALRDASRGHTLTVHIQRPECSASWFDLVIVPRHDYPTRVPPNALLTRGSLHGVTSDLLDTARKEWEPVMKPFPSPRLVVLMGGTVSRGWWQRPLAPELTAEAARALARSALGAIDSAAGSLLVTTSRRTPDAAYEAVAHELEAAAAAGVACRMWTPDASPNPFLGLLAWADQIVVTADSINMVTEACAAGKPIYVLTPSECRRRYAVFHNHLLEEGRTRAWPADGVLEPSTMWAVAKGLSDTQRAAARVVELLRERGLLVPPPVEPRGSASDAYSSTM